MKKLTTIILTFVMVMVLFTGLAMAQTFRDVEWGASREAVIETEGEDYVRNDEQGIAYERRLNEKDYLLIYFFNDYGEFNTAGWMLYEDYEDNIDYLKEWNSIYDLLEGEFGSPDVENMDWKKSNSRYRGGDAYDLTRAIAKDHLESINVWKMSDRNVGLIASADGSGGIDVMIIMRSVEYN